MSLNPLFHGSPHCRDAITSLEPPAPPISRPCPHLHASLGSLCRFLCQHPLCSWSQAGRMTRRCECPETRMAGVEVAGGRGRHTGVGTAVSQVGLGPRLTSREQACADPLKQLCVLPAEASGGPQGWLQAPPAESTSLVHEWPQIPTVNTSGRSHSGASPGKWRHGASPALALTPQDWATPSQSRLSGSGPPGLEQHHRPPDTSVLGPGKQLIEPIRRSLCLHRAPTLPSPPPIHLHLSAEPGAEAPSSACFPGARLTHRASSPSRLVDSLPHAHSTPLPSPADATSHPAVGPHAYPWRRS